MGIILYILLVGAYPFSTDSEEALKTDLHTKKINWPNTSVSVISKYARDFVSKLLEKDPKKRFFFFFFFFLLSNFFCSKDNFF